MRRALRQFMLFRFVFVLLGMTEERWGTAATSIVLGGVFGKHGIGSWNEKCWDLITSRFILIEWGRDDIFV
jgi:hypothetical protein